MPRLTILLLTAPLIAYVSTVSAEDKTYSINLPAQSLNSAIDSLAQQTGIKPFYADVLVAGKKSPAVKGQYSAQQALDKLLSGSGLGYKFNDKQAVAITEQKSSSTAPTLLPSVKVTANAIYDSTHPYNTEYTRPNSTTATKTDTPVMETPMSVKVIPQQVLRDQQVVRIDKALENVSGVYQQPSSLGDVSFFSIRGFGGYDGNSSFLYRNGVRASYAGADASFPDMANIELIVRSFFLVVRRFNNTTYSVFLVLL